MTPQRARIVALIVAGAFFMEFLDGTVIATALPAMAHDFGQPAVTLSVGISAYLLTLAVFIPLSGWVADRYGTRDVFTAAIALFTVASMLCGLCDGLWQFVGARVLQGLGGAMMVPVGRLAVLRTTEKAALVGAIALLTLASPRRPGAGTARGWPAHHLCLVALDLPAQRTAWGGGDRGLLGADAEFAGGSSGGGSTAWASSSAACRCRW